MENDTVSVLEIERKAIANSRLIGTPAQVLGEGICCVVICFPWDRWLNHPLPDSAVPSLTVLDTLLYKVEMQRGLEEQP